MFNEVVTSTNIIYYLMTAVGVVGILAKVASYITLRRLVGAAANMSKSTHKLIKLIRSKYEHACMLHDRVENTEAFVEKYIYEYRGIVFRLHTWQQLEKLSVWFAGILAVFGMYSWYMKNGFCEEMYQYAAVGIAEMLVLYVIRQLSDEQYKIMAVKNYIVDYLENVCALRYKKVRQSEREQLDVIRPESSNVSVAKANANISEMKEDETENLAINIEGTPRKVSKAEAAKQILNKVGKEKAEENDEPALREEAIRQILEEFLA